LTRRSATTDSGKLVEHHVEEEEEEMFPMAERQLGQGRIRELAEEMATQARQETERRSS
jgi:hemerythrin-like domain-containing protein